MKNIYQIHIQIWPFFSFFFFLFSFFLWKLAQTKSSLQEIILQPNISWNKQYSRARETISMKHALTHTHLCIEKEKRSCKRRVYVRAMRGGALPSILSPQPLDVNLSTISKWSNIYVNYIHNISNLDKIVDLDSIILWLM